MARDQGNGMDLLHTLQHGNPVQKIAAVGPIFDINAAQLDLIGGDLLSLVGRITHKKNYPNEEQHDKTIVDCILGNCPFTLIRHMLLMWIYRRFRG